MTRLAGLLTLLCLLIVGAPALAAPTFPPLTGRVVDDAHVLSPQTQADLTAKLATLEQKTSRQLVVVTLASLGGDEIDDYGYRLLRAWGIGQKATNNGALFIVVPSEHKVRVEVGYGLEGILTDALSSVILQRAVLPKFQAGDVQGGIVDGTGALIDQLSLDTSTAEAKAAQAAAAVQSERRGGDPIRPFIPIFILACVAWSVFGRRRGGMGWLLPMMILGGGRGGGWSGGGASGSW
jgi:uncharacterized protein